MKLSEQYARKINKLDEFQEFKKTGTSATGTDETTDGSTGLGWLGGTMFKSGGVDDIFTYIKYGAGIFLVGKYGGPIYRKIFKPGISSMKDWHTRFKNIKNLRKDGFPPHVSESAWRHFRNVIFQKDLHTLTDIKKKIASGQFTLTQGMEQVDRIMPNISSTQRYGVMDGLTKLVPAATNTSLGTQLTKGATTTKPGYPYYTSTSTATAPKSKSTSVTGLTPEQFAKLSINQRQAHADYPNLTYAELLKR